MLQCAIYHNNKQIVVFRKEDFPDSDTINVGFDSRCEVMLPAENGQSGVLFSILKMENSFLAVSASPAQPFLADGTPLTEFVPKPGGDFNIAQFRLVFICGGLTSKYSLIWRENKKKTFHAPLSKGANLIGRAENSWVRIDSDEIPELCCHCWIGNEEDSISIEPLAENPKIKLHGKHLLKRTAVKPDDVFQLSEKISASVIETEEIPARLKASDPFYPAKTFWQFTVLGSMLLLVGACFFYSMDTMEFAPGRIVKPDDDLPNFRNVRNVQEAIAKLEARWKDDIEKGSIKSVSSDVEDILQQKLPPELESYMKQRALQLKATASALRDMRYYSSRRQIYSLEKMSVQLAHLQLAGHQWRKDLDDNLTYWGAAYDSLNKDKEMLIRSGATNEWPIVKNLDLEMTEVKKFIDFHEKNKVLCDAYLAGDFIRADKILRAPAFQAVINRFPDVNRFRNEIAIGNRTAMLRTAVRAASFSPADAAKLQAEVSQLRSSFDSVKSWGAEFPLEKTRSALTSLEIGLASFSAAAKKLSVMTTTNTWTPQASVDACHQLAELAMNPLFEENKFIASSFEKIASEANAVIADRQTSIRIKSDLLSSLLRLPNLSYEKKTSLHHLSAKLSKESQSLCDELYHSWKQESDPVRRQAIAARIFDSSMTDSSYRIWAAKQRDGIISHEKEK